MFLKIIKIINYQFKCAANYEKEEIESDFLQEI